MLTFDRYAHVLAVSDKMYLLAKNFGIEESLCRDFWLVGYLHDIGYRFGTAVDHASVGYSILNGIVTDSLRGQNVLNAIREHGSPQFRNTKMSLFLNFADMTIDSKGKSVSIEERLRDIGTRYGSNSLELKNAQQVSERFFAGGYDEIL